MKITFANAYEVYNDLALAHVQDKVERIRYAGYAVFAHDLLMYPLAAITREYLQMLYRAEGLIYTGP
jgi:hypothetical protein